MSVSSVTATLDAHRGSLSLHRRFIMVQEQPVVLDHVLSAPHGAYLLQERTTLDDIDTVRRTAEALELAVLRPIEPVVVLDATDAPARPAVRGVRVVPLAGFAKWLHHLPAGADKADMVLVNARVEKATEDWDRRRRIPDWEVKARLTDDGIHTTAPSGWLSPPDTVGPRVWERPGEKRASPPPRRGRRAGSGQPPVGFLRGMGATAKWTIVLFAIAGLMTMLAFG